MENEQYGANVNYLWFSNKLAGKPYITLNLSEGVTLRFLK